MSTDGPDDDTVRSARRGPDDDTIRSARRRPDDDTIRSAPRAVRRAADASARPVDTGRRARVPDADAVTTYPVRPVPERAEKVPAVPPPAPTPVRARGRGRARRPTALVAVAGILTATAVIVSGAVAALIVLIAG